MRDLFIKFRKSEDGATLVEYGVALLVAIIVGGTALVNLGGQAADNMTTSCTGIQPVVAGVTYSNASGLDC